MLIRTCRRYRLESPNKWTEVSTHNNIAYRNITGRPASDDPLFAFLQFGSQMYDGESIHWVVSSREVHYSGSIYVTIIGWTKRDGNPFDGAGEWVIEKWLIRADKVGDGEESGRQWPTETMKEE